MENISPLKILFYHAHFFSSSETFIYQQAINPNIRPVLLAKRFLNSAGMSYETFERVQFKRSWWDGLVSNLLVSFGIDQYYQRASIHTLAQKIKTYEPDVLHAQFGFSAVRILPVAKMLKIPLVVSFHGMDASHMLRKQSYRNGLKKVFAYATTIVVCNPAMADVLPLTADQKRKIMWVPYGINLKQFNPQPRKVNEVLRILHVGRFIEKKGVPDLIRAFSKLKNQQTIQLELVGTGPEEKLCKQLVREMRLEQRVIFHGWKSSEEVKNLMQQADVFVLNSRVATNGDSEGLPVGILEAMSMALPVVSTKHAGIPHEVDHGVTGLLVEECDTEGLTAAISALLQDAPQRNAFGMAGRRKAESVFSMEQMHNTLYTVYKNCCSKQG
ncbi:MAG: glycosyltransferase [Bacteroidetes bacterium CHB5]|nr:glycosyltransferase [Bacteroidetes bacterium CHB5]